MEFSGFKEEDFNVFHIDGLDNRMNALIEVIRPKLEYIGKYFAPTLSVLAGEEIYYHIAKHARRTVNPPKDTWVAFSNNKRGYKKHPHFEIGLWESNIFIMFAVIYDSPFKDKYGTLLLEHFQNFKHDIPSYFEWSADHTTSTTIMHKDITETELEEMFTRLKTIKKAEILCGITISKEKAIELSGDEIIEIIEDTLTKLQPFYELGKML